VSVPPLSSLPTQLQGTDPYSMAWIEMRILIAKMVFLFDYELVDNDLNWERDSPAFILWQKPELWTKVTPRNVD
jgi:hypothetical protein